LEAVARPVRPLEDKKKEKHLDLSQRLRRSLPNSSRKKKEQVSPLARYAIGVPKQTGFRGIKAKCAVK